MIQAANEMESGGQSHILITGASGFIGKALAAELSQRHSVTCISRTDPKLGLPWIEVDFTELSETDLKNHAPVDCVVHLAGVTGGCSEEDGLRVNVEGTRHLIQTLKSTGCRKFVLASSIAVVGVQDARFSPLSLPMEDEHPCLDKHGYGFSKYMMEEVSRYLSRQNPELDLLNLRLAAICPDDERAGLIQPGPAGEWACASLTMMTRADAVRAFTLAAEADYKAGLRILNTTGPRAWTNHPTLDILKAWYGDSVDGQHYRKPGNENDGLFDVTAIRDELGFIAQDLPGISHS